MPATKPTKAFTLVELLVVVAIIAILASLLLPTLARAKSSAASAACRSNLHQLGLALSMYAEDQTVYPPWLYLPGPDFRNRRVLGTRLQVYTTAALRACSRCGRDPARVPALPDASRR